MRFIVVTQYNSLGLSFMWATEKCPYEGSSRSLDRGGKIAWKMAENSLVSMLIMLLQFSIWKVGCTNQLMTNFTRCPKYCHYGQQIILQWQRYEVVFSQPLLRCEPLRCVNLHISPPFIRRLQVSNTPYMSTQTTEALSAQIICLLQV